MRKLCSLFLLTVLGFSVFGQINIGGQPKSFSETVAKQLKSEVPVFKMPEVDLSKAKAEDSQNDKLQDKPWRFGLNTEVDISVLKDAQLTILENGDKIYRLEIFSAKAQTINIVFDNFRLPKGGLLYFYSPDHKHILGGFTQANNQDSRVFASELLNGEHFILDYFQPYDALFDANLHISNVTHGYRSLDYEKSLGQSGSCNINVACEDGLPWADQIRSVCMLVSGSNGFCSGALINNTNEDETPYILTADHCYSDPSAVIFRFNWQSETCSNPGSSPGFQSISGASLKARNAASDFCLYEMGDIPPSEYNVYYAGWNNVNEASAKAFSIHHPSGDIKKISFDDDPISSSSYEPSPDIENTHWKIERWERGTTEGGSSGSPLFNNNGLIIGQLHGGYASCSSPTADYFGKFSYSWNQSSVDTRQLKAWLDPVNKNTKLLPGFDPAAIRYERDLRLISVENPEKETGKGMPVKPKFKFINKGSLPVESVTVRVFNDDVELASITQTGTWATSETFVVESDEAFFPEKGAHKLRFFVSEINGDKDQFSINDSLVSDYDVHDLLFFEDFEDLENYRFWQLSGEFEIDIPTIAGINAPDFAFSGEQILGTDLTGLGVNPGNYESYLSGNQYTAGSPVIDCSQYSNLWLSYKHQNSFEGKYSDKATLRILCEDDTFEIWTNPLEELQENEWQNNLIDISKFAQNRRVRIQFSLGYTNSDNEFCGWNIDDLCVFGDFDTETSAARQALILYPNPTGGILNIELSEQPQTDVVVRLTDVSGRSVFEQQLALEEFTAVGEAQKYWLDQINLKNLSPGLYFIECRYNSTAQSSKLLVSPVK